MGSLCPKEKEASPAGILVSHSASMQAKQAGRSLSRSELRSDESRLDNISHSQISTSHDGIVIELVTRRNLTSTFRIRDICIAFRIRDICIATAWGGSLFIDCLPMYQVIKAFTQYYIHVLLT